MYKKILIIALSILGASGIMHGMDQPPKTLPLRALLQYRTHKEYLMRNEQLCKALHAQDLGLIKECLEQGANPNAKIHCHIGKHDNQHPIHDRVEPICFSTRQKPNYQICKLLLEYGANFEIDDQADALYHIPYHVPQSEQFDYYNLFFDYGAKLMNPRCYPLFHEAGCGLPSETTLRCLIVCPIFNPKDGFDYQQADGYWSAYDKIMTILMTFKRYCPSMPKDIRILLLKKYLELDCELGMMARYSNLLNVKEENAHTLPMKLVRMYIEHRRFNPEMTVAALKKNHLACIKPLMAQALRTVADRHWYTEGRKKLLDPELVEKNYGKDIENNIRRRLGLKGNECIIL